MARRYLRRRDLLSVTAPESNDACFLATVGDNGRRGRCCAEAA